MSFFVAALLDKVGDKPMVSPKNLVGPEEILRVLPSLRLKSV